MRLPMTATSVAMLLLSVPTPASATVQPSWLTLSVTRPDGERSAELACAPAAGGGHPHAAEACAELAQAEGDLQRLARGRGICPMVYQPVTAHATGRWQGRPVHWEQEFANACTLGRATGSVFDF